VEDETLQRLSGMTASQFGERYGTRLYATPAELLDATKPDLVLVDVMLPRLGGLEVVRALRNDDPDLPVLILSAKGQESDKVAGLQLGADDYMVKPFGLKELLARIDALLRRRRSRGETGEARAIRRAGDVELDLDARIARAQGRTLDLTSREFDLLAFFVTHPDRVFSREQLMESVWGSRYFGTVRTVDNFIARLRAHIGDDAERPRHLETVRGVGYRFNP